MKKIKNDSTITNLYITGHSLGGYLSLRATATAEKENQKLQKKLDAIDERKEQEYQKRISRYQLNVFLSEEEKKQLELAIFESHSIHE